MSTQRAHHLFHEWAEGRQGACGCSKKPGGLGRTSLVLGNINNDPYWVPSFGESELNLVSSCGGWGVGGSYVAN